MAEYINKAKLYNTIAKLEEKARKHYLENLESSVLSGNAERAFARLSERTAFKHLVADFRAADVVEVVRCQNCAYSHKGCDSDMTKEIWCTYWQKTEGKAWNMMHFDDFCSHGAKMDLEESK